MKPSSNPLQISRIRHFLFLLTLPLFCTSCMALLGGAMEGMGGMDQGGTHSYEPPVATEGQISFSILQMNDVYEIAPLENGKTGGMARLATIRNELMNENFYVLTVLAGDFLSPSLIGTLKYEGERIKGRQMVDVMNEMGVNLVALGNHEFDVSEQEFQQRLNESYFDWIATNLLHQKDRKLEPFYKESYGSKYFLPETYIWEITDYLTGKTLKVGFYSATINSNPVSWVYYEDPYQEATKAYLELLDQTDVVIGLTHLSMEQDLKMAALLPKTALIMGGHEHQHMTDTVGNVIITKADANAKTVYIHNFVYDIASGTVSVDSRLIPITDEIEDDPAVAKVVDRWQQIQEEQIKEVFENPGEVIYTATEPLDGREATIRNEQTNLGKLIAAGMAAAAEKPVDAAFFNGGSVRLDDQLSGDITQVDIFRTLPFGGGLVEMDLKGSTLKKVLEAGQENKGIGGYLLWYNAEYNEAGDYWLIDGKRLQDNKRYHVITNDYVAAGKEERLEFLKPKNYLSVDRPDPANEDDLRNDVRKAVVAYLREIK